jgi:hypothetical protein
LLTIGATLVARYDELRSQGVLERPGLNLKAKASLFSTPYMKRVIDAEGIVLAVALFLLRYALLFKDNEKAGVRTGAQYIDVYGVLSTVNYIHVSIVVELALCALVSVWMSRIHDRHGWILEKAESSGGGPSGRNGGYRRLGIVAAVLLAAVSIPAVTTGYFAALASFCLETAVLL